MKFLNLLHAGAWAGPGLAVVCTYRSEEEQEALHSYRHLLAAAPLVKLDRFDETVVGAIVRDMLGVSELDERFVRFLAQRSEGNPFFIAEYLRTAVAEGLLQRDQAGRWRLAALSDADLAQPEQSGGILLLPAALRQLVAPPGGAAPQRPRRRRVGRGPGAKWPATCSRPPVLCRTPTSSRR